MIWQRPLKDKPHDDDDDDDDDDNYFSECINLFLCCGFVYNCCMQFLCNNCTIIRRGFMCNFCMQHAAFIACEGGIWAPLLLGL